MSIFKIHRNEMPIILNDLKFEILLVFMMCLRDGWKLEKKVDGMIIMP